MEEGAFARIVVDIVPFVAVSACTGVYSAFKGGAATWKQAILSVAGSAICGGIVGWYLMGLNASPYMIGATCGVAGLIGENGLRALETALIARIKKQSDSGGLCDDSND